MENSKQSHGKFQTVTWETHEVLIPQHINKINLDPGMWVQVLAEQ